jgi:2-aminoadipate transaminase
MTDRQLPIAQRAPSFVGSIVDSSTSLSARQIHGIGRFAMGAASDDLIPVDLLDGYAARRVPGSMQPASAKESPASSSRSSNCRRTMVFDIAGAAQ